MTVTSEHAVEVLSKNINAILSERGWSRYRLAQESGVSEQTIGNICKGLHEPRTSIVVTIANALGVSIDRLVFDHFPNSQKNLRSAS